MLAHDAGRSGATTNELQPPFSRQWYRLFTDEGLMSGVQPIAAQGKVFIGTLRGLFYALDAETGKDLWKFPANGAVLHAAAVGGDRVIFGAADGTIYALRTADGTLAWEVSTGSAVWNAPAIHHRTVFIGSRDQRLYAIDLETGSIRWTAPTAGPILCSPAIDAARDRVYVGSEDMCVYAFSLRDGKEVWRSPKLPGISMRGYHPVVAPDGSVLVTTAPGISVDTFQAYLVEMTRNVFGDFASWRNSKEVNAILREENFAMMAKPETFASQLDLIRKHLAREPAFETFFVLHPETGKRKFIVPIVYSESMNGPGAPAVIGADGQVIVKFQALLRSRYEHYSPFLNVGELNTSTGDIRPLMDQSRTYGWHDSLLLVHDEQSQLCVAGPVLINTHQDNVNAMFLPTQEGYLDPFCRNIHEPKPGEALTIWTRLLRAEPLPAGKEWLSRGTAVYGGGSVLDSSVTVVADQFYYLPTHELNAGAAIIAYRMKPSGHATAEASMPRESLSTEEWQKVQKLPWDWDTLEHQRLRNVLEALPGPVPGTRQQPLTNEAARAVADIRDNDLERLIWEAPARTQPSAKPALYTEGLREDLARSVKELIEHTWQPLLFPAGKFPEEAYWLFSEPTETLVTLAMAYPHLPRVLQEAARQYVQRQIMPGGVLNGPVGQRARDPRIGEVRSAYSPPPEKLLKFQEDVYRSDVARLYPIWAWAYASSDWSKVEKDWPRLAPLVHRRPNKMEEDCWNGYLAGLIAYCRMAHYMNDPDAIRAGSAAVLPVMRERLLFEFAHPRGGVIWQIPRMRAAFSRWHFLTPEIGRMLREHTRNIHQELMNQYVEYHRPTWWLAWNVETVMRNECPYEFPSVSSDIFAAKSLVLDETAEKLAPFIDRPWCRADEFYIQKLALTLDATAGRRWVDVRGGAPLPSQPDSP